MNKGSLTYSDYYKLFKKNIIKTKFFKKKHLQPSSMDLTLSNECYEIKSSFLSPNTNVREKLKKFFIKRINLDKSYIFKKKKTYLVKLNENLNLSKALFGKCNPKSSTGRLDIFCRTILNFSNEYEKIPKGYKGELFLEITSQAFDIKFKSGDSLNQIRLINRKKSVLSDFQLLKYHKINPLFFSSSEKLNTSFFNLGLKISVDLDNQNSIIAYKAKKNTPTLEFNKTKKHKINDFWKPIKAKKKSLIIKPGNFYILKSKERIRIPKNLAGEMIPYDTAIGDFRVHYAGFFDPGFGGKKGSYAVLEVKTNEVPFELEDGQIIASILYENLNKAPKVIYGSNLKSNYQNQKLALSKHFNVISLK